MVLSSVMVLSRLRSVMLLSSAIVLIYAALLSALLNSLTALSISATD